MFEDLTKLNIATCPDTELIAWVRQAFPIFEEVYRRFCTSKPMSCHECFRKVECDKFNDNKKDKICLVLEPLLPSKCKGTGYREKNAGVMIEKYEAANENHPQNEADDDLNVPIKLVKSTLRSIKKTRLDEVFLLYQNCPPYIFTSGQWEAVCLRFENGLRQQDIAEIIGIPRSAVSDRLRRAKKNMEKYYERNISNNRKRQITSSRGKTFHT